MLFNLALLAIVPSLVLSQSTSPIWGQCAGIGYTGPTTCAAGSVCTYNGPYYSQCLPGSGSGTTTAVTSGTTTVTKSTSGTTTVTKSTSGTATTTATSTGATASGNPFVGYTPYLSPVYAAEVAAAAAQLTGTQATLAASVANIPTFIWLDQVAKVPDLATYLQDITTLQASSSTKYILQIVVYDLPDRDCAAAASNGEFTIADNGQANYFNYIDQIVAQIKPFPNVRVVAVIEPDSLANLVTNLDVAECAAAQTTYLACTNYAIEQLNSIGVYMYLDAGHAGWLGWPANLAPAAQLFNSVFTNAGSPAFVRGLATNTANYNSLTTTSPDPITSGNPNYDELLYITALSPLLTEFPAHFIVDQGRSGVQDIRQAWGDWCNVKGAGFGIRPTTNTPSSLIDSIVWVKPGGECDGTSNSSAPRYDYHCSLSDAAQPSPQAGTWFQAYFATLVSNANPPL